MRVLRRSGSSVFLQNARNFFVNGKKVRLFSLLFVVALADAAASGTEKPVSCSFFFFFFFFFLSLFPLSSQEVLVFPRIMEVPPLLDSRVEQVKVLDMPLTPVKLEDVGVVVQKDLSPSSVFSTKQSKDLDQLARFYFLFRNGCGFLVVQSAAEREACLTGAFKTFFGQVCEGKGGVCVQNQELSTRRLKRWFDVTNFTEAFLSENGAGILKTVDVAQLQRDILADEEGTKRTIFFQSNPIRWLFAMAAFDGLALIASICLMVLAIRSDFWIERKSFVLLLALLAAGTAVGVCAWTFSATGSQLVGVSPYVPGIPRAAVDALRGAMAVVILLVFAVFAVIVIQAVLDTFYPEKRRIQSAALVVFIAVTAIVACYTIAMTVIRTLPDFFLLDVSDALQAGTLFAFSATLAVLWLLVLRLVTAKKTNDSGLAVMRRNALIFFSGSAVLAAVFLATFMVALLSLLVNFETFNTPYLVLLCVGHALAVLAILGYVGTAVISAARGVKEHTNLEKDDKAEKSVPLQYQNY